jgi:hypothetical protein
MQVRKHIQTILGLASVSALSVAGLMIPVSAQDSTVTLDISAGALTMYAGDATDNNDLCENGNSDTVDFLQDDGTTLTSVDCSSAEQTVSLTGLSVRSIRQDATTTFNDILFEDLSGTATSGYTVSAVFSDLINNGAGSDIVLGDNPDNDSEGNLSCTIDPSGGSLGAIAPASADTANLAVGSSTEITVDSSDVSPTSADIFSTTSAVTAGRYDIDSVNYSCRIPAFVEQGSYTQTVTFTVTTS